MMGLVDAPEQIRMVLQPVKPIDVEIVSDEEKPELSGDGPGTDQLQTGETGLSVDPDDDRGDQEPEQVALGNAVAEQIGEQALTKQLLTRLVGIDALETDQ